MNNNLLSLSANVLSLVIEKDYPFSIAIKAVLKDKKIAGSEKKTVSSLVGCSLRHFYIFDRKINEFFPDLPIKVKLNTFVYLANALFLNSISYENAKNFIKTSFENEYPNYDPKSFNSFIDSSASKEFLATPELNESSLEFLSIRFNTPLWLVKMWGKHFKENILYKTLRANSKPSLQYLLVNTSKISASTLVANSSNFEETSFKDMVLYKGKERLKDLEEYKEELVFPFNPALSYALDTCDLDPFRSVAIFTGYNTNVYLKFVSKFTNRAKLDLITDNSSCYFDAKNKVKEMGLERVRVYEQNASSIISCVSTKVDTFIVMPRNSNFASFKTNPDYFLKFKQSDLDSIIQGEKDALHEASLLLQDGGELLYAVPTLSVKEGRDLIKKFLLTHPDLVLAEEKQIFPFTSYDTTMYFARLRKVVATND